MASEDSGRRGRESPDSTCRHEADVDLEEVEEFLGADDLDGPAVQALPAVELQQLDALQQLVGLLEPLVRAHLAGGRVTLSAVCLSVYRATHRPHVTVKRAVVTSSDSAQGPALISLM